MVLIWKEIGYPNNKIEERIDADCSPIPPQGDCTIPFQTSKNLTLTFPGTLGVHVSRRADKQEEDLEESRSPGPAVLLPLLEEHLKRTIPLPLPEEDHSTSRLSKGIDR